MLHGIVLLASARGLYLARHLPTLYIICINIINIINYININILHIIHIIHLGESYHWNHQLHQPCTVVEKIMHQADENMHKQKGFGQ